MWLERFREVWTVAASIAPFLGIIGFIFAARRDRLMLATALGLLVCGLFVLLGYRVGSRDAERVLADAAKKNERIAQLEAQLARQGGAERPGSTGAAAGTPAGGSPTAGPNAASCPLNDTWECAEVLRFGEKDSDEFRANDQVRFYVVDIPEPRVFTLTLDPTLKSREVIVTIHDVDRRQVNRVVFPARGPGSFDTRVRAAGRYFIKVSLWFCCPESAESYTISLAS